jgi:NAD(P)-dependent dehydrogenase (short-subunit alcohol dehydrogenase family)
MPDANVTAFTCDLSSDDEVAALALKISKVDVLVNNAGVEYPTPLTATVDMAAGFVRLLDNNVTSMARLTNALLPVIPDGGCVINQASVWGRIGVAGFSAYVASKHAEIGLTRSFAWELGARDIRVNAVCPGWVFTDAAERSLAAIAARDGCDIATARRAVLAQQAIPREIQPAEIARSFLFLASDDAAAITGQSLVVSRGEVMA